MNKSFDSQFQEESVINWLPYVGQSFFKQEKKILLVGESHYIDVKNPNDNYKSKEFTRWIVEEQGIQQLGHSSRFFKNVNKLLSNVNDSLFWDKVAFMNFIQVPMINKDQRPSKSQFVNGWDAFFEVVKILKPNVCLFLGNSSADYLNKYLNTKDYEHQGVSYNEKINGAYFKEDKVEMEYGNLDMFFIKHPSKFFRVGEWNEALSQRQIFDNL